MRSLLARSLLAASLLGIGLVSSVRAQSCDDEPLSIAAFELLAEAALPSGPALLRVARDAGSDLPLVEAYFVRTEDEIAPLLTAARARMRAPVACGLARAADRALVLIGPRAGRLGGSLPELEIELSPGYTEPLVFVELEDGGVEAVRVSGRRLLLARTDVVRAQLVARGPDGPRPVAERELGRGGLALALTGASLEERLDALRLRMRSPPLRPNRRLAQLAREHAESVCRAQRAAHEVQPGVSPVERLEDGHLEAREVGEVIARASSEQHAFVAMLDSLSHRAALLDRRFTDVGIGRALDARGHSCAVVLLAAWPRAIR